jgi:hypothetical protein
MDFLLQLAAGAKLHSVSAAAPGRRNPSFSEGFFMDGKTLDKTHRKL